MALTETPAPTTSTVRADRVKAGQTIVFGGKPCYVESRSDCDDGGHFAFWLVIPGKEGARPRLARWCDVFELL